MTWIFGGRVPPNFRVKTFHVCFAPPEKRRGILKGAHLLEAPLKSASLSLSCRDKKVKYTLQSTSCSYFRTSQNERARETDCHGVVATLARNDVEIWKPGATNHVRWKTAAFGLGKQIATPGCTGVARNYGFCCSSQISSTAMSAGLTPEIRLA
ncbi:MAG: hypothetical protein ACI3VZ_01850 [Faecousia sp.]